MSHHPPRLPPVDYRNQPVPYSTGAGGVRPSNGAPPLPPLPPGALQREQERLRQTANYNRPPLPAMPQPQMQVHQPPLPLPAPYAFVAGQFIPPPPPPSTAGHYAAPSNPLWQPSMRLPSPAPPPPGGGAVHARFHSMQEIQRPASAASGLNAQHPASNWPTGRASIPSVAVPAPRHYSIGHLESLPSMQMPSGNPLLAFGSLSVDTAPVRAASPVAASGYHQADPRRASRSETSKPTSDVAAPPPLNVPLPDLAALGNTRERALASGDEKRKLAWAKSVIKFVERKHDASKITDPALVRFTNEAISMITRRASADPPDIEALYLRGDLQATGSFPTYLRKDLKSAFNDFELSARMGWAPSWFRIGRDYEVLNDAKRAMDAYDRGCAVHDVGCLYRRGMSLLLGQLGLRADHAKAIPLLRQAADLADMDTPQPSYIYGMLLAGEFSHVEVPSHLLVPVQDTRNPNAPVSLESEARRRIECAAYLNFAPAQYKCGWMHEYAQLDCPFDPLLSVQYYSLASQGGEIEADMALSKWFLCGAEGCFDKNEDLAFTFAEKAARKGLASAEFALAYYYEVGVGCDKDVEYSRKWYKKAAAHGNTDAKERLAALEGPAPVVLSRTDHQAHVDGTLVRKRTEAKNLSDRRRRQATGGASTANTGAAVPLLPVIPQPRSMASNDLSRKHTMRMVEESAGATAATAGARGRRGRRMNEAISPISPATNQVMPIPAPVPVQATVAEGRHGSGYSLSETYVQQPQLPQRLGGSSPANGRPAATNGRQSAGPPPPGTLTPPPAASATSSGTSSSSSKPGVVYESFHEMGFASKKAAEEEKCVVC